MLYLRTLVPWRRATVGSAWIFGCLVAIGLLGLPPRGVAEQPAKGERLRPAGLDGTLFIGGGGNLSDAVMLQFVKLAGGDQAHLVIIPTANADADKQPAEKWLEWWQKQKPASVALLHTRSRSKADEAAFVEPLRKATGVWFTGGSQDKIAEAYLGTAVEKELYALLKRNGVVGGSSAGAAIMSRLMIVSGNPEAKLGQGFDLLPGTVIDQHFHKRHREPRLMGVLTQHPGFLGLGVDEGTAVIVHGRTLRVVGESTATICLAASKTREPLTLDLKDGASADLTAYRRSALVRAEPPFPPLVAPVPNVPDGSLIIVGGGGMPDSVTKKFIELAGGPEALIVILPTAQPDPVPKNEGAFLARAGAKNVKVLPSRELKDVEDPKNLEILKKAGGIWFGGGRQWRFVDAYAGTKAHEAFREVLHRGGVIGGSSAGATIQGDYLCRGSPFNNTTMMCEGYERGLGFLPGVAIDQHFTQRNRLGDMTSLMNVYPQLLGIGLDETTAILVHGTVAEVMGKNQAHFYNRRNPVVDGKPDHESLSEGERYELKARKVLPGK